MSLVTVALTTDTGKRASYGFPGNAPFENVICKDLNLEKDKTTFFVHFQVIAAEDLVQDAKDAEVFVATEGRFLRPEGYSVVVYDPKNVCLGRKPFPRLPSKAELFEVGAKFYPASDEFILVTKHGLQSARKNDTRPLIEDDLFMDPACGYPSNQLVLKAVPKGSLNKNAIIHDVSCADSLSPNISCAAPPLCA